MIDRLSTVIRKYSYDHMSCRSAGPLFTYLRITLELIHTLPIRQFMRFFVINDSYAKENKLGTMAMPLCPGRALADFCNRATGVLLTYSQSWNQNRLSWRIAEQSLATLGSGEQLSSRPYYQYCKDYSPSR